MEINWPAARMRLVGQDASMYNTVAAAIEAIIHERELAATIRNPEMTNKTDVRPDPEVILVYPGTYVTTSPLFVPPFVGIKAIAKWFPVMFQNDFTDMFACSEFNWFQDFVVTQGKAPGTWVFRCNDKSDITVHGVNMYRRPLGLNEQYGVQQGFLHQSGPTWKRLAIYDCLVDNATTSGYSCLLERTPLLERTTPDALWVDCFIDHIFFDAWELNYYGGSLEIRGCQDVRVRYSTLRGAVKWNTSIRVEKGGVEGQPQVDVRHCFTQGGISLYNEPGTLITVVNCDSAGARFCGKRIVHNSYWGPAYDPLHPEPP